MSPAKKKTTPKKRSTPIKKTEASSSETKSVASKQGFKKKLNEFGDDDAL